MQWAIVDIDALDASIDALRIGRISTAIAFVSSRRQKMYQRTSCQDMHPLWMASQR